MSWRLIYRIAAIIDSVVAHVILVVPGVQLWCLLGKHLKSINRFWLDEERVPGLHLLTQRSLDNLIIAATAKYLLDK